MLIINIEKEENNDSKCSAFALSKLLNLFFTSNSVAFVGGAQEYFLPRAQGALATPL